MKIIFSCSPKMKTPNLLLMFVDSGSEQRSFTVSQQAVYSLRDVTDVVSCSCLSKLNILPHLMELFLERRLFVEKLHLIGACAEAREVLASCFAAVIYVF